MDATSLREAASNAVGFWERARIAYDLVLVSVVAEYFVGALSTSMQRISMDLALGLFVLAVVANDQIDRESADRACSSLRSIALRLGSGPNAADWLRSTASTTAG
jgi:hypothetical protein